MKLANRWHFTDRQLQDFVIAILSLVNGNLDVSNAPAIATPPPSGLMMAVTTNAGIAVTDSLSAVVYVIGS